MSHTIEPLVEHERVAELREAVRGETLTAHDEGYDEAAKVWNGAHDGYRPAVIVRCTGVADVLAAVAFARTNHLPVAVRGGGHSVAGFSTIDCGIVIDLGPMNDAHVDPVARRASVGGARSGPTSTTRPRRTDWRPPAASSRRRGSRASRWAAASAG
jgi:hypothetical protein